MHIGALLVNLPSRSTIQTAHHRNWKELDVARSNPNTRRYKDNLWACWINCNRRHAKPLAGHNPQPRIHGSPGGAAIRALEQTQPISARIQYLRVLPTDRERGKQARQRVGNGLSGLAAIVAQYQIAARGEVNLVRITGRESKGAQLALIHTCRPCQSAAQASN